MIGLTSKLTQLNNRRTNLPFIWLILVLAVMLLITLAFTLDDFRYDGAWASAVSAIIARYFAQNGILATGGVPIENYAPLTAEPDTYLHWPPLLYYLLACVASILPNSVRALHFSMAAVTLASAATLWLISSKFVDRHSAAFCASAFLLMPVTLGNGLGLIHQNLALFEVLVALLFALRYRQDECKRSMNLIISALAFLFACLTSWEVYLATPGFLIIYWIGREQRTIIIFITWTIAASVAAGVILTTYALGDSAFIEDIWSIAVYRAGAGSDFNPIPSRIHPVEGWRGVEIIGDLFSFRNLIQTYTIRPLLLLGPVGVLGTAALLILGFRSSDLSVSRIDSFVFLPMMTIWLGWQVIMHQHYSVHEYELLFAAPCAALGAGLIYSALHRAGYDYKGFDRRNRRVLIDVVVPILLLLIAVPVAFVTSVWDPGEKLIQFGLRIQSTTPAGAIVITNEPSPVPVYYAERHMIRGVRSSAELRAELGRIVSLCHRCPLYLAVTAKDEKHFYDIIERSDIIFDDGVAVISRLQFDRSAQPRTESLAIRRR